jgi:K+-transporting ATPase ATPase C chain
MSTALTSTDTTPTPVSGTGGRGLPGTLRRYAAALRTLLVLTVVTGLLYPLLVTAVGAVALRGRADGSLISSGGQPVGSALIGQSFTDAKGVALPRWFQTRPTAYPDSPYDGAASAASNLGPDNADLLKTVQQRRAAVAAANGVPPADVPSDALTASGSGLEPYISPAYAALQVDRVARARGLSADRVRALVAANTAGRQLGFLGEPRVNVVTLNAALAHTG